MTLKARKKTEQVPAASEAAGIGFALVESEQTKKCSKCEKVQPLSNFHKTKANKGGVQAHCKVCVSKMKRQAYNAKKKKLARTLVFNSVVVGEPSEAAIQEFGVKFGEAVQGLIDVKKL